MQGWLHQIAFQAERQPGLKYLCKHTYHCAVFRPSYPSVVMDTKLGNKNARYKGFAFIRAALSPKLISPLIISILLHLAPGNKCVLGSNYRAKIPSAQLPGRRFSQSPGEPMVPYCNLVEELSFDVKWKSFALRNISASNNICHFLGYPLKLC